VSHEARDLIQPFMIDAGAIRGRLVRLGAALDTILSGHNYPGPVAERLAETLALATALAGSLKFEGIFTLQIQSEGALPLVVADITSAGHLRGYARYDEAKLAVAMTAQGSVVERFFKKGFLAFTVDQGPDTDRYQGIVELTGKDLADCAHEYFRQSEQLETGFRLAVRPASDSAERSQGWQAAVIMIQRMPTGPQSPILTADEAQESWRRAEIMMGSAKDAELFDPELSAGKLLYRLYHADGLHLYDDSVVEARCRCSAERVEGTLKSFPREQVEEMRDENGKVAVVCEFCKTGYHFDDADLDRLYGA